MLELAASRHKPPSICWLCQHASWRRLALRARRRWRGRCAPGACGEPELRLALRARRSAHGAARRGRCAPVCWAGRRSRRLPSPPRATRSPPRAWALRARAPAAAFSPPRATRSAPKAWALRAQAPTCCPPTITCCALPLGGGDVEDVVRFALLETLGARRASRSCRGRGWVGTPRGPHCRRCRHARAERRYGGSRHEGGARAASPPRQRLAPPARRRRAAGAPWEELARAARFKRARLGAHGRGPLYAEAPQAFISG